MHLCSRCSPYSLEDNKLQLPTLNINLNRRTTSHRRQKREIANKFFEQAYAGFEESWIVDLTQNCLLRVQRRRPRRQFIFVRVNTIK